MELNQNFRVIKMNRNSSIKIIGILSIALLALFCISLVSAADVSSNDCQASDIIVWDSLTDQIDLQYQIDCINSTFRNDTDCSTGGELGPSICSVSNLEGQAVNDDGLIINIGPRPLNPVPITIPIVIVSDACEGHAIIGPTPYDGSVVIDDGSYRPVMIEQPKIPSLEEPPVIDPSIIDDGDSSSWPVM